MKMKFLIGAIGVIVAGIYVVKKLFDKNSTEHNNENNLEKTYKQNDEDTLSETADNEKNELENSLSTTENFKNEINQTRFETEQTISERHRAAADIIKESAENILNGSLESEKDLDKIYNDLNNM